MATNKTSYVPSVTEIEENVNISDVPFTPGQFVISDSGQSYYDPTNGTSTDNRISLGGDGKQTVSGGFQGGQDASATSGAAIGSGAHASSGGAVGSNASTTSSGFAGGASAHASIGGAVGANASATESGFAGGYTASATEGGAVGSNASATDGGAVGYLAKTSTGFAGGYKAKTQDSSGDGIDAIQLGTGTNSTEKTLQVYDNQLLDADGHIPKERLASSVDGIDLDSADDVVHFGVCSTSGSTATKIVSIVGFKLIDGARVFIKFNNANTYIGTTYLNINNTGAKQISVLSNNSNDTSGKIGLLSNRVYEFVYYNDSYYAINALSYYPTYNRVYGPQSNNTSTNHLSYKTAGSTFPSLRSSSTLLLPGNYSLTSSNTSVRLGYYTIVGYTKIIKPITKPSSYSDITDTSTCSKISVSNPTDWLQVMSGASYYIENIIFDLSNDSTDDSSVGLYSDYGLFHIGSGSCVKFKNCVFNVKAERAFLVTNGSIEFENCAFFLAPGETVCHHFIDAICSFTTDEINIKFTNCYFVSEVTSGHAYTSALAGYNVNLTIENCELINVDPFKVEYSNLSNTNGGSNILIRNNKIKTNAIGAYDASSGGYTNGSLIFSNNLVESDDILQFYVQGGSQSMISNNTFNLEGSYASILYYARSSSAMTNSFVGNTSNSQISLSKLNNGSAYITVTGNCINGQLSVSGFTKSSQGYNVNT